MSTSFVAKIIRANGQIVVAKPDHGETFSLEELQNIVGGVIEIIEPPSLTGAVIICNEEGKLSHLPRNTAASMMWQEHAQPGSLRAADDVVGDVLLCHKSQLE